MADLNLRTDLAFDALLKKTGVNLSAEQKEKVEAAAAGGFDENELAELKELGVSRDTVQKLCEIKEGTAKTSTKTAEDITAKAEELANKYCKDLAAFDGDKYTSANPELQALKKAIDDGVVSDLAADGFTKLEIAEVISKAFPNVGIKVKDGKYTLPKGHDEEGSAIYNSFKTKLLNVAGGDSEELIAKRKELQAVYNQIADNNRQIQAIEYNIIQLQDEIEETIEENIDKSKEIAEEHKEASKKAVKQRLNEYANSNGEMKYSEFQTNLKNDLDGIAGSADSELAKVIGKMMDAERKMTTLSGYLDKVGVLMNSNETLTGQIPGLTQEISDLEAEQEAANSSAEDSDSECTDPIGWTSNSERYDLFVDKDNNGDITNEQEFLGAADGFKELQALDKDNDGTVTKAEMVDSGIKIIHTKADGTQEIKNAADVFADGDSINLKSYEAQNKTMSNGNELLGTFDLTFQNKVLDDAGYQTLDQIGWLDANYEFTEEVEGTGRFADDYSKEETAIDFSAKLNEYKAKFDEQQGRLDEIWQNIGIDSAEVRTNLAQGLNSSEGAGLEIERAFEATQKKELEEAKKAENEAKAQEAAAEEEKDAGKLTKEECENLGIDLSKNGVQEIDGKNYKVENGKVVEITNAE